MQHAPIELLQIGLDPHQFKYSDSRSWRGPCPVCGGHRRFVMFTDNTFPLWHGYCDECGTKIKAWEKVRVQYDPQRAAALEASRAREEAVGVRCSGRIPLPDGRGSVCCFRISARL